MKFIVGTILVLVLSVFLALIAPEADGLGGVALAGYVMGTLMVPLLLAGLVLLVARLIGKAQAPGAWAQVVFYTVAVVVAFDWTAFVGKTRRPPTSGPVTEAERQGLEIGPDSIRHRGFGFALPHPGKDFQAAPDMQRALDEQFATQPNLGGWALQDGGSGVVVVLITKGGRVTEPILRAFANGVRRGMAKGEAWGVLEDTLEWSGATREYRFWARNDLPAYLGIRCLPGTRPDAPVIVCVETVASGREDRLRFVRAGLAVGR